MVEPQDPVKTQQGSFQFSIKYLFILVTVLSILTASCVYLARAPFFGSAPGPYKSFDDWPLALKRLVNEHPECKDEVAPWRSSDFDHCSLWRIGPNSKLRKLIDERYELLPASILHPKAQPMIDKLPGRWAKPDFRKCKWFATPDYGKVHMEGVDLFIIADDPTTGESFLMHEWIF